MRRMPIRAAAAIAETDALTERERKVLRFLVEGRTDEEIAAKVRVTSRAVRHTLRALYDRLGVEGRVQAAARAVRLGLQEEERDGPPGRTLPEKEGDGLRVLHIFRCYARYRANIEERTDG